MHHQSASWTGPEFDPEKVPEAETHLLSSVTEDRALWTELRQMLHSEAEQEFVKSSIVGESIIEENAVAAKELQSLLSILSDMRMGPVSKTQQQQQLAPPPQLRPGLSQQLSHQVLQQRLATLLDRVNAVDEAISMSASARGGTLPSSTTGGGLVSSSSSGTMALSQRERMVAEYVVCGNQRPSSAASSARRPMSRGSLGSRGSGSGRDSARGGSETNSNSTGTTALLAKDPSGALQPLKGKLKFDRVHEIAPDLKALFLDEKNIILQDVDTVRQLIEDEMKWLTFKEPSQAEVKSLSKKVEDAEKQEEHERKMYALPSSSQKRGLPPIGGKF